MSERHPRLLGSCPGCDAPIRTADVLIEYEADGGRRAVWAECPDCAAVVHPE